MYVKNAESNFLPSYFTSVLHPVYTTKGSFCVGDFVVAGTIKDRGALIGPVLPNLHGKQ